MDAPTDCPTPAPGKRIAWTRSNWGSGRYGIWYVVDDKRKIVSSTPDIFKAANLARYRRREKW